jgi:signal transduction histidine kinase
MNEPGSLRRKLFWRLLTLLLIVGLSMAGVTTAITARTLERNADKNLEAAGIALLHLTREEWAAADAGSANHSGPLSSEDIASFSAIADSRVFAVLIDDRIAYQSDPIVSRWQAPRGTGLATVQSDDGRWRLSRQRARDREWAVVVGEPLADRHAVIILAGLQTILPLLLLAGGAAGLLFAALRDGLSDLRRLEQILAARSPHDLAAVADGPWPPELQGVVSTLNRLFRRVRGAFTIERRVSAMAAHQLRTPLAAMRLQTQILTRGRSAPAEGLGELQRMIDLASDRIDQMLRLARVEATPFSPGQVDLVELAGEVLANIALVAAEANVDLELEAPAQLTVHTDRDILRLAIEPLLENALRHGADGGILHVRLFSDAGGISLMVLDRGSKQVPIDRDLTNQVNPGLQGGLGLLIVASAVRALGGSAFIGPRSGGAGTVATICFAILEADESVASAAISR